MPGTGTRSHASVLLLGGPIGVSMKWPRITAGREVASTAVDLAGAGCVAWSAFSLSTALGALVLGAVLIAVGWVIGR